MARAMQLLLLVLAQLHAAASLRLEGPVSARARSMVSSPFNNTLMVIHCRLKVRGVDPTGICEERRPLFRGYEKYFAEVIYITQSECPRYPGDPQSCMAKIMMGPGANRDGVFYLHFDALVRPQHLGLTFDVKNMYTFDPLHWCEIDRTTLDEKHCPCRFWNTLRAEQYQGAIQILRDSGMREFQHVDLWQFWTANDDMFYYPRSVYDLFVHMAPAFANVHHEVAGPSIRAILKHVTRVPVKSLGCTGGCCAKLSGEIALRHNFTCGHSFDLQVNTTRDAFPTAIRTFTDEEDVESYMPLETWKKVLELALE